MTIRILQGQVLAYCLLLIMTGCAAIPQTLMLSKEPGNLPGSVLLNEVAFFPQVKYQCGPAALATVLSHRNIDVDPEGLTGKVYIPERKGSLQIEMVATARSYGKLTYPLEKQLKALLSELAAGNPVLVFQNLAISIWPQWHYAVAVGYDLNSAELILRSGTDREHRLSFASFERSWQRGGHWAYVVMSAGEIPATALPKNYLLAAYDLESIGFKQKALESYRIAATRWPKNTAVLMALGNSEYSMGFVAQAKTIYSQVIQLNPEFSPAWNNLAYALADSNCYRAALSAAQCASRLAPDDNNITHSVSEISALNHTSNEACKVLTCPVDPTD